MTRFYLLAPFSNLSFFLLFFLACSLSFSLFLFLLHKFLTRRRIEDPPRGDQNPTPKTDPSQVSHSLSKLIKETQNKSTHLTHSLLLDILGGGDSGRVEGSGGGRLKKKNKKKRAKKKRVVEGGGDGDCERGEKEGGDRGKVVALGENGSGRGKGEYLVCLYPFTSTSSATQRKIKQQYDQLVKCNETKGLTLAEVGEFANCLIEARNELQHKSEVIKRKFTITKALLFKADRSSIDRLRQQIYKLEMEQKRLEEDTFVYNWLQQQLKLSPAYEKMLEISTSLELKAKSGDLIESDDHEFSDISFEELLAQEKKDSFWQKNAKSRSCSN